MARKFFGTDGVRGTANQYPMTADMALKIGAAAGRYFRNDGSNGHRVVIGKDTRLSGYMFENALTAGLTSTGMNVLMLGPIPTPGVGLLTTSMRADLGIMISASIQPAQANNIGRAKHVHDGRFRYAERLKGTLPAGNRLDGLKVVIDCANGAAHRVAPEVLWELGATVIPVGTSPDGYNINDNCGSTNTRTAAETIVSHGADVGICLDGDADRLMILDENGQVADGDQIMGLFAHRWAKTDKLHKGTLVATVMSNLGLERFLAEQGLNLLRTNVGDRYVVEAMRANGYNLGGEQSGHIVMTDYATTGDGLLAGLQFLTAMIETGKRASELCSVFETVPQMLKNVRYKAGQTPLDDASVKAAIKAGEADLKGQGRLLIRKSGTEPLIRVMAESEDDSLLTKVVNSIVAEIEVASSATV